MGLLDGARLVAVDTETTGFDPARGHELVEVARVAIDGGALGETWATLIRPQRPIPPDASRIHRITDDMVAGAPPAADAAAALRGPLGDHPLVFHNAPFDLPFLRALFARSGLPPLVNPVTNTSFTDTRLGLAFHSDSAFLRGIMDRIAPATAASINGAVIAARSENDTGNNPHNPMYGINRAGANGELLTLIGSRASDSGGNSMAPAGLIDLSVRPTKIDRASDVRGLVDTGQLVGMLGESDTVAVLESVQRISARKIQQVDPKQPWADPKQAPVTRDEVIRELVSCGYLKAADTIDRFGNPSSLDPDQDPDIVGSAGIFSQAEYDSDDEFRKTAAVMKMVISGYAGAGTIEMGGYDYHGQGRATGENRDFRAGRCMGACLEYAARRGVPLMLYVFSDGSLSADGQVDTTADGRGKFMWASDNQSTAASFFLVYNPGGRPTLLNTGTGGAPRHQQIGYFRPDASVETASSSAANNVNLLVETVVLNYMALHGEHAQFGNKFPGHGLGSAALQESLIAFNQIVAGTIA